MIDWLARAYTYHEIAALPDGKYRMFLGKVRNERRVALGKKPKRLGMKRDAADDRWSHDVKERDRFCCRRCGAGKMTGTALESAHVVPREYPATRRDLGNGLTLCKYRCHKWAHEHLGEFVRWVAEEIGPQETARLRALTPSWKGWQALDQAAEGGAA